MGEKTIISSTGRRVLYVSRNDNCVKVADRLYPIYPYGNYVEDWIEVCPGKIERGVTRDNWGETGTAVYGYVELTETEYKKLYEAIANIKTFEDFNYLSSVLKDIIESREKQIEAAISNIFNIIMPELAIKDEKLRLLKNVDEIKKHIIECIDEYLSE